jgi:hypothetical protein
MVRVVARQTELILRASDRLGLWPSARAGLEMPERGSGRFDGLIGEQPTSPQSRRVSASGLREAG